MQDEPNLKEQEEDCVEEDDVSELCDEISTLNQQYAEPKQEQNVFTIAEDGFVSFRDYQEPASDEMTVIDKDKETLFTRTRDNQPE